MNHVITEGLRKSLADLRENEERCRDAALAIQRVLEAEGALYPPMDEAVFQAEVQKVKAMFAGPVAKPAKAAPKISRKAAKIAKAKKPATPGPRTWPKTCVICGKDYAALSASSKCCSPACVKEKNIRYARAGYQAQKRAAKRDEKAVAALDGSERVCAACGKKFTAHRKDQKCCSTACGKSGKGSHAPKVLAPAAKLERANAGQPTRLERIRAAAERMDGIPESVRAAVAEARESEVM
jgi:hypothetical protein